VYESRASSSRRSRPGSGQVKDDFKLVKELGIKETGILVSCSDYHIFKKMKMTRRQAVDFIWKPSSRLLKRE
jgi:isopropylmalate/homocitrate/citramalate synthase